MRGIEISLVFPILGTLIGCRMLVGGFSVAGSGLIRNAIRALPRRAEQFLMSERLDVDLHLAGSSIDATGFRARQLAVGTVGALAAGVLVSAFMAGSTTAIAGVSEGFGLRQAIAVVFGCALAPAAVYELSVRHRADRARDRATAELAELCDLLCIAISAGESIRSALALVAGLIGQPLRSEVEAVLSSVAAGTPFDRAIRRMAERIDRPAAVVIAETLSRAHERGMGLADQLRALAKEVREGQKAAVVESMGRRQMLMIVPVVFLILPTALVFAALPGFYTLQLVVG